jgi:hypothetical protein
MLRRTRSVVPLSLLGAMICGAMICGAVACGDSTGGSAERGTESEESSGNGDGDPGDGDGDSGDGDGDSGDGDGDSGDGDGVPDLPDAPRGCVVHVNQANGNDANLGLTWVDAKATVQAGLDEAGLRPGCQVWVAEGTYRPTDGGRPNDRSASFVLDAGQRLYGGFAGIELFLDQRDWVAHPTILSGDIGVPGESSDNSQHVVECQAGGRIDGFQIRDGSTQGFDVFVSRDGAGIYAMGGSLTVANAVIADHRTGDGLAGEFGVTGGYGGSGAGIYMLGGALTLDNVTISGNRTGDGGHGSSTGGDGGVGAGLHANGTLVDIHDSVFSANHTGDGGDGELHFGGYGGAGAGLHLIGGALTLDNVTITGGQTGNGGHAGSHGGNGGAGAGLFASATTIDIRDSMFSANHTGDAGDGGNFGGLGGDGAGLHVVGGTLTLAKVTITGGQTGRGGHGGAQGGHGGAGAGLQVISGVADIRESVIASNHTGDGGEGTTSFGGQGGMAGGAMAIHSSMTIVNTLFEANSTGLGGPGGFTDGERGGYGGLGYLAHENSSLVIANSEFVGNQAAFAAGMHLHTPSSPGASVTVVNTVVRANIGEHSSGGVHLVGDGSASVVIANTAIVANHAISGAGIVYMAFDAVGLEQPRLLNSIVWGNIAPDSSQIFANPFAPAPSGLLIDATDVEGGCPGASPHFMCLQVHDLDPQFVDLSSGDLHLLPASPLLDLGLADHLPPDLADLDNDGDFDEPTPLDLDMLDRVVGAAPELGPLEIP